MLRDTMKLTNTPADTDITAGLAWNALFDAYGFDDFHLIEGRGVLKATLDMGRNEAIPILQSLVDKGFAKGAER